MLLKMIMNVIIFSQYLNFCNEWWYMLQFEALNQIKYLQPSLSQKKKLATIYNEDYVIHTFFFIILFYEPNYDDV